MAPPSSPVSTPSAPDEPPHEPVDKPLEAMSVDELAVAVRYHNHRYFSLNDPVISDYAFDRLTRRLIAQAPDHPVLAELSSDAGDTGEKVFHDAPMLSLDKAYDEAGVLKWAAGFEGGVVQSPKVDGVAASLKYDAHGSLVLAVTRGDGVRGENFTANARFIADVPKEIGEGPVEVRGEIYMPLSVFATFEGEFSSPRNTTAGAIKQKEPHKTAGYGLSFFAYDVLGREFDTEMAKVVWARANGFPVVETQLVERDAIQAGYERWLTARAHLDYELDGVVYKTDSAAEQRQMGATSHHPKYAIAYKFQGESGTSVLRDVEWSVSRTGAINPIAIIDPVFLSGANVSRCSLHNLSIMAKLGVTLGATVVATRRGGVIPHIEAISEPGDEEVLIPAVCPSCASPTERVGDVLFCTRPIACPATILGSLQHYANAAEIDGFGPKIVAKLLELGLLREPADFYALGVRQLVTLERMGEVLARKLVASVDGTRRLPLGRFLRALGVQDLGRSVSALLAEYYKTLDAVLAATEADLASMHGVGEVMAATIVAGLETRRETIARLREHVTVEDFAPTAAVQLSDGDHPLAGKSVVFTGKLARMDRKSAQKLVREHGGTTPSSVSKALDFLVVGDDGSALLGDGERSTKHKKADKHVADGAETRIISEADFDALVSRP